MTLWFVQRERKFPIKIAQFMRENIKKIKCSKIYFEILNILEKFYFNFFIVKIVLLES